MTVKISNPWNASRRQEQNLLFHVTWIVGRTIPLFLDRWIKERYRSRFGGIFSYNLASFARSFTMYAKNPDAHGEFLSSQTFC